MARGFKILPASKAPDREARAMEMATLIFYKAHNIVKCDDLKKSINKIAP